MSNLASRPAGANPAAVDGAHLARDPFELEQPSGLRRPNLSEGSAPIPWLHFRLGWDSRKAREVYRHPGADLVPFLMLRQGATPAVQEVFHFLGHLCRKHGHRYCYVRTRSFEAAIGMPESTARKAIRWLARNGWVHRAVDAVDGESRIVLWCTWLLPDTGDGAEFEFGHGSGVRLRCSDAEGDRLVAAPARRASSGAGCAPGGAHGRAPKQDFEEPREREESSKAADACVARLDLAGEGGPREATPAAPPATPEPPGLDPAKVAELVAILDDGPPADTPRVAVRTIKVLAYRELAWAGALPARLADACLAEFGPAGEPDRPRPRATAPPAPPTTVELIRRLADPTGPEAIAAAAERLGRDLGAKSGAPFRANLGRVASGEFTVDHALDAYALARAPGARAPGAVFNGAFRRSSGARP